jgi:hypothetical protein
MVPTITRSGKNQVTTSAYGFRRCVYLEWHSFPGCPKEGLAEIKDCLRNLRASVQSTDLYGNVNVTL